MNAFAWEESAWEESAWDEPACGESGKQVRQAYRAWIRAHHPDLGGDPEAFIAGLARWHAGTPAPAPRPGDPPGPQTVQVWVFRSRGGLWQVARWWQRRRSPPVRRVR